MVYHKPTFTGLLTNFRSCVPLGYKLRLIKTLIDRIFKINNTWKSFHGNVGMCANYLSRNLFPKNIINRNIKEYLDKKLQKEEIGKKRAENTNIEYFKLQFVGDFSTTTKKKVANLYKRFCKEGSEFRLVFNKTKVREYFSTEDSLPECFQSYVVYLFKCTCCNVCYGGRTHTHLTTRIAQHFHKESSVFRHLDNNTLGKEQCTKHNCFKNVRLC